MNRTLIMLAVCGLLPVAVFAQSPSAADLDGKPTESVMLAAPAATEAAEPAAQKTLTESRCLRETGSRVAARRNNAKRDSPCLPFNGRSYSREDIERTGEVDIADALRKLDPAIR